MKHIKLFEGYLDEPIYREMSYNDYMSSLTRWCWQIHAYMDSRVDIMDDLYNRIVSLFDSNKWGTRGPYYQKGYDRSNLKPKVVILRNNIDSIDMDISILDDQWFLVGIKDYRKGSISTGPRDEYYKCDTWDGLIEFLKDKKIIE